MLSFSEPAYFLLLAGWIPLWRTSRKSLAGLPQPASRWALALRCTILALVALALAGPKWRTEEREAAVVFLIDRSLSVGESGATQAMQLAESAVDSQPGAVHEFAAFAAEPERLDDNQRKEAWTPDPARPVGADLARALDFASGLLPTNRPGRVVVFSDGLVDDDNDAVIAALRLRSSGIEIDTIAVTSEREAEVQVDELDIPTELRPKERFDATLRLQSTRPTKARLRLYQNDYLVGEREEALSKGASEHVFKSLEAADGGVNLRVAVEAEDDAIRENNAIGRMAITGGKPRVLVIDPDEAGVRAFARALEESGFLVEVRGPDGLPNAMSELQVFDLVVLSDTPARSIGLARMELLRTWIKELGGGLLVTGGENSYAAGGYFQTALAEILPVRIEFDDAAETPLAALLVILDRSGSMSAIVEGQTKMALANQGAVRALDVLQAKDLFGVLAVDTVVHSVVPLGRVLDRAQVEQKVLGITAGGGGIYIYTSLGAAYRTLSDANARIRHVILFSDAADAEEKHAGEMDGGQGGGSSFDLAGAMLARRITVSIVALGSESDRDTRFLRMLAERGGGRFYLTSDAMSLPRLFMEEALRATGSNLIEEVFRAKPSAAGDVLRGVEWESAPFLLGYNATRPREMAENLLLTEAGEPLLARWQVGLGQVAAFTSDVKPRWATEWLGWSGFGKLFGQLARALTRREDAGGLRIIAHERGGRIAIEVEATDEAGRFRNDLKLIASLSDASGKPETREAEQIGPGVYRAEFEIGDRDYAVFAASDGSSDAKPALVTWSRGYPREYAVLRDGEPLLRRVADVGGGLFNPTSAEMMRPAGSPRSSGRELWPYLVALALLLAPVDIWLRRRHWTQI
jgi:Ca-activated chloride channel family protein